MTILSAIRDRLSTQSGSSPAAADDVGVPFVGYDNLDGRQVIGELSDHSQVELEAVETYERSHQSRESVLDKLRYMRGSEPLPGYDALSVKEIVAALANADLATIKKVRGYERKFANRPDVLEEVVRVHHQRLAAQPASTAPAYQPLSATSPAAPDRERTQEPSGRP